MRALIQCTLIRHYKFNFSKDTYKFRRKTLIKLIKFIMNDNYLEISPLDREIDIYEDLVQQFEELDDSK